MKKPKITIRQNKGGSISYCVDSGINPVTHKRDRRFFETKKEADDYSHKVQTEQKQVGELAYAFTPTQRIEAAEAFRKLEAVGASLTEAVDKFLSHHKPRNGIRTVEQVVSELIERKRKSRKKPRYIKDITLKYAKLKTSLGGVAIHEISGEQLEELLDENEFSAITYNNYLRDWGMLFSFAKKSGYCAENVVAGIEKHSELSKPPGILSPEEAELVLSLAKTAPTGKDRARLHERESLVPYIAIGLFAGLRSSEIEQLDWKDVNLGEKRITVQAEIAKTSAHRRVTIPDNLVAWLEPYRRFGGPIVTEGWRDRLQKIVRKAELFDEKNTPSFTPNQDGKGLITTKESVVASFKMPKNALRHSYASYHYEFHHDAGLTAKELGHESPKMLFKHYHGLVSTTDAQKFWNIYPQKGGILYFSKAVSENAQKAAA